MAKFTGKPNSLALKHRTILMPEDFLVIMREKWPIFTKNTALYEWQVGKTSKPDVCSYISLLYLTGSRVSEPLGMRISDIVINPAKKSEYVTVQIPILKKRVSDFRSIPLFFTKPEFKIWKTYIKPWFFLLKDFYTRKPERASLLGHKLFPKNKRLQIYYYLRLTFEDWYKAHHPDITEGKGSHMHPHFFRHNRAFYLRSVLGFSEHDLVSYFGWSNPTTSFIYSTSKGPTQFIRFMLPEFHPVKSSV